MGKRSYKQAARSQKGNAGCMWGLISMFDFRLGHSRQKLLSDRKHGSGRCPGTKYSKNTLDSHSNSEEKREIEDDFDEDRQPVDLGMPSVKALMEEEMSRDRSLKKIPSDEIERILSDLGHKVYPEKNHRKTSKNQKLDSYFHANNSLDCHVNSRERCSLNLDLASFLIEFYGYNNGCQELRADNKNIMVPSPSFKAIDLRKHDHHDGPGSQIEQMKPILQKALGRVAEVILNQKLVEAKQLTDNRAAQSEEFSNALEILNSNKELFLKLLQDPQSLLLEHIQELHNTQIEKLSKLEAGQNVKGIEVLEEETGSSGQCEESIGNKPFHKQSKHKFFRRKNKSKGTGPQEGSVNSEDLNRIVVLKPSPSRIQNPLKPSPSRIQNPSIIVSPSSSPQSHHSLNFQEHGQNIISHFSLKEIKRRLRHFIGESKRGHHLISMDGVLHKIPYESKASVDAGKHFAGKSEVMNLASKTPCNTDNISQSFAISKKTDKKNRPKECQLNVKTDVAPSRVGSFFYEEAKKHLAEMLHTGDQIINSPIRDDSEPLGRILSLPEYSLLSPRFSPTSDRGLDLSPKQTRLSPSLEFKQEDGADHLSPLRQNSEITACNVCDQIDEIQVLQSKPELIDTEIQEENCTGEVLNLKEIVEVADAICLEGCNHMVELSESCCELDAIGKRLDEEGPEPASLLEKPQPMTPSLSILPSSSRSISEKLDRPSPVSVLDPFFLEDIVSPESTSVEQTELPMQPQELHFQEHDSSSVVLTSSDSDINRRFCLDDKVARFEYIKTVLEVSGLSMDEILKGWHLNNQFLDPSLFDEVGTSYVQLQDNPRLLFDCINEVVMGMQERFFRCTPLVSFVKPVVQPVPTGGDFVQEVSKGIDRHLQMQFPITLDQIVRKDLEGGTWVDLRFEIEGICIEIEDTLLDDLTEESVYEFWFEP